MKLLTIFLNAILILRYEKPHFVRCVKPNTKKMHNLFFSHMILQQLRYAGMMETIRIRQQGYALRQSHEDFFKR